MLKLFNILAWIFFLLTTFIWLSYPSNKYFGIVTQIITGLIYFLTLIYEHKSSTNFAEIKGNHNNISQAGLSNKSGVNRAKIKGNDNILDQKLIFLK